MSPRSFVIAGLVACIVPASAGCYGEEQGPPPEYASSDYEPMYYDGYVVYYDDAGRPYYHENGVAIWVATSSPYYAGYVSHWRTYGRAYGRWYGSYGARYRGYSRGRGYYGHRR